MSKLDTVTIELSVGDQILIGKSRTPATITKIEYHERSGDIELRTTKGMRRALTFSLPKQD